MPVCLLVCVSAFSFQSLLASLFVCVSAHPVACIFTHLRACLPNLQYLSVCMFCIPVSLPSFRLISWASAYVLSEYSRATCLLAYFNLPICMPIVFVFGTLVGTFSTFAVNQSPSTLCLKCKTVNLTMSLCHFCVSLSSLCPSRSTVHVYYVSVTVFLLAFLSIWLVACI